jgi:hypothetical protein
LGQIDGFLSVGEIGYFGKRGLVENRLCGCGTPITQCVVWKNVIEDAFGGIEQSSPEVMIDFNETGCRTRQFPLVLTRYGRNILAPRIGEGLAYVEKLYRSLQNVTGAEVIVDSTKNPAYGKWLETIPSIDFYVVHMIRDPRASAYSWRRKKLQPDTENLHYMHRMNIVKSSLLWDAYVTIAELLWARSANYMRLYYEDFAARPQAAIQQIMDLVGKVDAQSPFISEHEILLSTTHTISGNPIRFQEGPVSLRLDDEWKSRMRKRDKLAVTAITWPLLLRYKNQTRQLSSEDD